MKRCSGNCILLSKRLGLDSGNRLSLQNPKAQHSCHQRVLTRQRDGLGTGTFAALAVTQSWRHFHSQNQQQELHSSILSLHMYVQ